MTDRKGVLSRIDPDSNKVVAQISVKPYSYAAMAGFGAIWVTNTGEPRSVENGSVQRIDPKTNTVVATIAVRNQPHFSYANDIAFPRALKPFGPLLSALNALEHEVRSGISAYGATVLDSIPLVASIDVPPYANSAVYWMTLVGGAILHNEELDGVLPVPATGASGADPFAVVD